MANPEHWDPYVVLGVRRQATTDEIARAYRRAARVTHPDSGGFGAGAERFRAVSDAYQVLGDPGRRAGYDRLHPLPRQPARAAGGSARYAAPGSQHVVVGPAPARAAVRPGLRVGGRGDVPAVRRLGEIEEMVLVALSLLWGGW
jgi:curved DNA-binding protein CbpA